MVSVGSRWRSHDCPLGAIGQQSRVIAIGTSEGVDGAGEVGKRSDVVGALETAPREHRREPQPSRGVAWPRCNHHSVDTVDDVLEHAGTPVESPAPPSRREVLRRAVHVEMQARARSRSVSPVTVSVVTVSFVIAFPGIR